MQRRLVEYPRDSGGPAISDHTKPFRFLVTGFVAGGTQIALLAVLTQWGMGQLVANLAAFLFAAQINFLMSRRFTWRDRRPDGVARRWLIFHASIAGTALLNIAVYAVAIRFVPTLPAAALGIAAASIVNFIAHDRLTFRTRSPAPDSEREERLAA